MYNWLIPSRGATLAASSHSQQHLSASHISQAEHNIFLCSTRRIYLFSFSRWKRSWEEKVKMFIDMPLCENLTLLIAS